MKTFIIALIGLLSVTLGAPLAEAHDKDCDHWRGHHRHYYHAYPRAHYYRSAVYPRYYAHRHYYRYPYYGYHRRPFISFGFRL
jgi:hypothetical protein